MTHQQYLEVIRKFKENTISICCLQECNYNPSKGLWETDPEHWVYGYRWVVVAFPWPTKLERGVQTEFV